MVIRFQVDPDFYDHPKSLGLSDAATALWCRAGSYSAAKLTDGFIAEHVLALLSSVPEQASDELRRRGLWHKVRGGYRFHEWEDRNLTKSRVEGDRKADRERKKANRATKNGLINNSQPNDERASPSDGSIGSPQVTGQNVHTESTRNPHGIQPESEGIPGASVSVSVSESVSGSGQPPAPRCPDHHGTPHPPPCGACADARRALETWERDQAAEAAAVRSAEAHRRAETLRLAIAACDLCNPDGRLTGGRLCTHDPHQPDRATRGAQQARDILAASRKEAP